MYELERSKKHHSFSNTCGCVSKRKNPQKGRWLPLEVFFSFRTTHVYPLETVNGGAMHTWLPLRKPGGSLSFVLGGGPPEHLPVVCCCRFFVGWGAVLSELLRAEATHFAQRRGQVGWEP